MVIIAAAGYFLYGEISQRMEARAFENARVSCLGDLQRFYGDRVDSDLASKVSNCVVSGYMSEAEVNTALNPKID
ncbi:MAG: hypothetical protein ACTHJ3_07705 [Pararhizobium sp.]